MGGRLLAFAHRWREITTDSFVLSILSAGYSVNLNPLPAGFQLRRVTRLPRDPRRLRELHSEIESLLSKGAIIPVRDSPTLLLSSVFLTPKRSGGLRLILNLKRLNRFVDSPPFKMETLPTILPLLSPHDWAVSIDLQDAYLHIPIAPESQRFLGFKIGDHTFCYKALPFGLRSAPRVFTRIVRVVAAFLRRQGLRVYCYLDDWLLVAPSRSILLDHTERLIQVVQNLGFIINWEKSALEPTQIPEFLGATLDIPHQLARPAPHRMTSLMREARALSRRRSATAKCWLRVLGMMASMVDLVPNCRFHMRPIQLHLLRVFRPSRDNLNKQITLTNEVRSSLAPWYRRSFLSQGKPFRQRPPSVTITTDASLLGWGAHMGDHHLRGIWTPARARLHINILELLAVHLALQGFRHMITGRSVLVRTDNNTVVAYLNKQGGTRSRTLCLLTRKILQWTFKRHISIQAVYIPGVDNHIADFLSRGCSLPTEWQLNSRIMDQIFLSYGRPQVDLFASALNAQLPLYCSKYRDPRAMATDAFSIPWSSMTAYAFPPIALIPRILLKIQADGAEVLLLAPLWPRRPWFPLLLELLAGIPSRLPPWENLIHQPGTQILHPHPDRLCLTLWPLCGDVRRRRVFRTGLPLWSRSHCANRPGILMIPDWPISRHGVTNNRWIRPRLLSA